MNRPQAVRQPPMAALNPTQATAAQEKKPLRLTSESPPLAAGAAGTILLATKESSTEETRSTGPIAIGVPDETPEEEAPSGDAKP